MKTSRAQVSPARIVSWVILAVVVVWAAYGHRQRTHSPTVASAAQKTAGLTVGVPLADFSVQSLDGRTLSIKSFEGRPLWINFFATWCPPCKAELPQIELRYVRDKGQGLVVLGLDQQESAAQVKPFAKRMGMTFPVVIDPGGGAAALGVNALPTSVFVSADGIVQAYNVGQLGPPQMDADLAKIIH